MSRLQDVIGRGLLSARPAAGTAPGGLYEATDDTPPTVYRDNGASWDVYATSVPDVLALTTAETDATKVLAPDGAGGIEWRAEAGGGGGLVLQRPATWPVTPTDDFDAVGLDAGWVAHSNVGAFARADCITQARDGSHLRMGYTAQNGTLHRVHANTDLDVSVGALRAWGQLDGATGCMWGIAALNSVGTGVGMVVYNDGNIYLASITTWGYTGLLQTIASKGHNLVPASEYWLRLVRVGNNWTGYASLNGKDWGTVTGTSAVTIVVDRVALGLFYNGGSGYDGALEADWYDE